MAIRQYIGARYVLKIYENSVDPLSAEWESNTAYEPLTMVNYNNSSYISRKEVPPTVGNPVDNPTYWALSGLYNGQIANLQSQIDDLKSDKLYDFKNRGFIFQGDSFDTIHTPGWSYYVDNYLGCDYSVTLSGGGYGFRPAATSPNYGKNWIDLIIADTTINEDAITDIVVCGGSNDRSQTDAELMAAMQEYDAYVKSRFPNLKNIYLGFIGFDYTNTATVNNINASVIRYKNYAAELGWCYLDGVQYVLRNPGYIMPDQLNHLNTLAVPIIGRYITQAIKMGSCEYCISETTSFTEDSTKITSTSGTYNVVFEVRGGMLKVIPSTKQFTAATDLSGTITNLFTSNMGNFMTRSLGIDVIVRYNAVNHLATLKPNADNVANLDLVLEEPSFTIPNGSTFIIFQCYRTVLL